MSTLQLHKPENEFTTFMQNIMFYTLLFTVEKKLVLEIFIQLGVATGEMDISLLNEEIKELYRDSMQRKLVYNNIVCKEMENIEAYEWIEYLLSLDRPWRSTMIYNEDKEAEIRRSMKNQNVVVDKNRTYEKITNISQLNHNDMYEVTILNIRSLELTFEKLK